MKFLNNIITTLVFSAVIFSCTAQTKPSLTAGEFEKEITTKENIQILDVRTPGEYFSGHIKHALQADWNDKKEFERRLGYVDKNKPVYVYCLAGGRSAAAADKMRKMGYENVYELKGGTNAWRAANKPLEGNSNEKQMSLDEFNATVTGSKTVLVDFGAEWCPPCKKMKPIIDSLENEMYNIIKVDGGTQTQLCKELNITAFPTFIVYKNGKEVERKQGVFTKNELKFILK